MSWVAGLGRLILRGAGYDLRNRPICAFENDQAVLTTLAELLFDCDYLVLRPAKTARAATSL